MAWISDRDVRTAANYRFIQFEGGRILQARELKDLQDTEAQRSKWENMAVFREGALVNVRGLVSGLTLTLQKLDGTSSVPMLAMVNGVFEPIPAGVATIPIAEAKTNATDPVYLHWILWKVTHNGTGGTLQDTSLIDNDTNEPVGIRGQLQIRFSLTTALSDEPLDSATMVAKSTTPLIAGNLEWNSSSVATFVMSPPMRAFLSAKDTSPGLVRIPDSANSYACAHNDTRLNDQRVPLNNSVNTFKVGAPDLVVPDAPPSLIGTRRVMLATATGIAATRLFCIRLESTVEEALSWIYDQITVLASKVGGLELRMVAVESRPAAQPVDLSFHVGKELGRSDSHPPTTRGNPFVRFAQYKQYNGPQQIPGNVNTYAFQAKDIDGRDLGGIKEDGNFVVENPSYKGQLQDFASYYKLALWCRELARTLTQHGIPVPPGAPLG